MMRTFLRAPLVSGLLEPGDPGLARGDQLPRPGRPRAARHARAGAVLVAVDRADLRRRVQRRPRLGELRGQGVALGLGGGEAGVEL